MQHKRFVGIFLGICLASYALLIGMVRTPLYCRYSHTLFDAAPCFKAGMSGIDTDVLLVGDSSLLYAIKPDLVAAAGGGKVYNLGMIGPSFAYQVRELIDGFLASNKRPRAIVLYFAARELISHERMQPTGWAPVAIYLLRHGSWGDIAHFLTLRPSAIIEMPAIVATGLLAPGPRVSTFAAQMQGLGGFVDYGPGNKAVRADCRPGFFKRADYEPHANRGPLLALRQHYQAVGIPLFIYVAPVAKCDNQIQPTRRDYSGVSDNIPAEMPNQDFADDTFVAIHVHPSTAGVVPLSNELAKFIRTTVQPRLAQHP